MITWPRNHRLEILLNDYLPSDDPNDEVILRRAFGPNARPTSDDLATAELVIKRRIGEMRAAIFAAERDGALNHTKENRIDRIGSNRL